MYGNIEQEQLISHSTSTQSVEVTVQKIAARIKKQGDKPYATVALQLKLLEQLTEFAFGRFLILNQGINGYWTHYMLTHPWFGRKTGESAPGVPLTELEVFILDKAPLMLATQERFEIFLQQNQVAVKNDAALSCIPCGMMGELLYLDFTDITHIKLIGYDYDPVTLDEAKDLAAKQNLAHFIKLNQGNAWKLDVESQFDLISSNGLTIYEPDNQKVTELYRLFYNALKPGGKLVTSFVTPPLSLTNECEWDMTRLNQQDLLLQKIIFADILEAKFQCYRSSAQSKQQLEVAGFKDIQFIYDKAKLFPTVLAYK
ncbi:SAM-dependent methyltransferase [Legionella maioricensis]|uniref:Class I SAM-dependent methyltransferase n=1 Tax=Legionella maioricensis TaxID=2896528 RepID=A0A9X2IC37_9GAMM|nr:class I SAM-dependent methyltransferase [Legionella maioricensis]MCL9683348.1 class I SAM-dependent methyltransferase [Legionella maioricensis]MCL9685956.1 class I SAM-dependent methyltransferase [Legionella maioricensis]